MSTITKGQRVSVCGAVPLRRSADGHIQFTDEAEREAYKGSWSDAQVTEVTDTHFLALGFRFTLHLVIADENRTWRRT